MTKRDVQAFCGMLVSLQGWSPSISTNVTHLRAATGARENLSGLKRWRKISKSETENEETAQA